MDLEDKNKRKGGGREKERNGVGEEQRDRDPVPKKRGDKGLRYREWGGGRRRGGGGGGARWGGGRSHLFEDRSLDGRAILLRGDLVVRAGGGIAQTYIRTRER